MNCKLGNNRARAAGLLLLLALLPAAAGCRAPVEREEAAPELRVAVAGGLEAVPLIAALETGIFAERGVPVELVAVDDRPALEIALQSGAADGFPGSLFDILHLQDQGFLAMAASTSGTDYLLVASSRSGLYLEDMAGITVALSESIAERYLLEMLLLRHGLDPAGVELLIEGCSGAAMNALLRGEAGAALLHRPLGDAALRGGARYLASTLDEGLPGGVLVFSGEALQEQEELLLKFYAAYREAVGAVNRGEVDIRPVLVEKWGYPEWWLERKPEQLHGPRPVTRDAVNDAVAWFKSREQPETDPLYESLVWRGGPGDNLSAVLSE